MKRKKKVLSVKRPGKAPDTSAEEKALSLLRDPLFLFNAGVKIGELGVVGEERNRLILFLAGTTRMTPLPGSVLVKGATSSGKTTLVRCAVRLFPPDCVVERAGLSGKALAYGEGSLAQKVLFLNEYRCGKDAQLLLRLLQSEGRIRHEFTTVSGSRRGTEIAERVGMPVVLTTTTDQRVFADDETRFLSVWADESADQNLAILLARASGPRIVNSIDVPAWQIATSLLTCSKSDFQNPPSWLRYVAEQVPLGKVRVRRDWERFLSLCCAIALCRGDYGPGGTTDITFADYSVAYRILEPVLASTLHGLRTQEFEVGKAVAKLNRRLKRAATIQEVAGELQWDKSLVYKYVRPAVRQRLVEYESGTREKNVKRLLARDDDFTGGFLPHPRLVLRENPEIGKEVRYVDPFDGSWKAISREPE